MIILQDSIQLQQNQEIKVSDTIAYLNTNAEQPFSDRPIFRPEILPGRDFKDTITGVPAVCSISGTRYGIVNNTVTQFAVNQPPIEDDGIRGCPAFTQLATYTEYLSQVSWGKNGIVLGDIISYQGVNLTEIVEAATSAIHSLTKPAAFTGADDNSVVGMSFIAKANGRTTIQAVLLKKDSTTAICNINLITGVVSGNTGGMIASASALSNGYYRIFVFCSASAGGSTPNLYLRLLDSSSQFSYTGDGLSGIFYGQPTYINFGVNGTPFIPPYVPNNTSESISVVSEAATSTTGTSFDLDNALLARLKTALRGVASGGNLWQNPVELCSGWTDDGTNYISAGGNEFYPIISSATIRPQNLIEISLTTGNTASGDLRVYVNSVGINIPNIVPNTTYTIRDIGDGNISGIYITSNTFIGEIIKSSISVKEVQAQGHLKLTFKSNIDSGWATLYPALVTTIFCAGDLATRGLNIYRYTASTVVVRCVGAGASSPAEVIQAITPAQILKIVIDWGTHSTGQKMRITVNGVKSALANFSGSFGDKDLRFFFGNTVHAGWIVKDSLKVMDRPQW